jgi:hypothetical protein
LFANFCTTCRSFNSFFLTPNKEGFGPRNWVTGEWYKTCEVKESLYLDFLKAKCKTIKGDKKESTIRYNDCKKDQNQNIKVENINGNLKC